ncbi:MAG: GNAT family N-acetyltransferase [Solirubrobacteraceae bacterium]
MIRSARAEDIPRLIEVQRRASLIWDAYREQLEAHPEVIDVPAAQVRLGYVRVAADAEDRPLGFSAILPRAGHALELDGLFVLPEQMRHGIGGRLVQDVVERAHHDGIRRIEVDANPGALAFYKRHGFRQTGVSQTRFGPAPRLALEVSREMSLES